MFRWQDRVPGAELATLAWEYGAALQIRPPLIILGSEDHQNCSKEMSKSKTFTNK